MEDIKAIEIKNLKVVGSIDLQWITEFTMDIKENCHAQARVKGTISEEEYAKYFWDSIEGKQVTVIQTGMSEEILFSGFVQYIKVDKGIIDILLISATALLDRQKKSRSFQNINCTYKQVINAVMSMYENFNITCNLHDAVIPFALIQYQETDWEFIMRIASLCNGYLYPDVCSYKPHFYCGLPQENAVMIQNILEKTWKLDAAYYQQIKEGKEERQVNKKDFLQMIIGSHEFYHLGNKINNMKKGYICKEVCQTVGGVLVFHYKISANTSSIIKRYNPNFKGTMIKGKVLLVQGNKIKVHLDIDQTQDKEKAFWYKWTSAIDNLVYCMPEVGGQVELFFLTDNEKDAIAISCSRPEGISNSKLSDFNKRYFITAQDKEVIMNPDRMGFYSYKQGMNKIVGDDRQGIELGNHEQIKLTAKEVVKISAEKIMLMADSELLMVKKSLMQPSVLNINNGFDVLANKASININKENNKLTPIFHKQDTQKITLNITPRELLSSTPMVGETKTEVGKFLIGAKVYKIN